MTDEVRASAGSLIASLEEALGVFDLQHAELETARQHSDATQGLFKQFVEGAVLNPEAVREARDRWASHVRSSYAPDSIADRSREAARLSLRWETALCDAFDALIRLFAAPEA